MRAQRLIAIACLVSGCLLLTAQPAAAGVDVPTPGGVVHWAGSEISGGVSSLAGSGVAALTRWVASGAAFVVGEALDRLASGGDPRVGDTWFEAAFGRLALVATLLSLPLFLLGIVQAALRGSPAMALRVLAAAPIAALITGAGIGVTQLLLTCTDELTALVVSGGGNEVGSFAAGLTATLTASAPSGGLFALFLVATVCALAALLVWLELLVREGLVYVLVGFLPLASATLMWPQAAGALRRVVRVLVAVILSKLVIAGVIVIGIGALTHAGTQDRFEGLLVGAGMLVIAAFSPIALLRVLPLFEEAVSVRGNLTVASGARRASGAALVARGGSGAAVAPIARTTTHGGSSGAGARRALRLEGGAQ
ncbi:MAG TPA: hypothetical protein VH025_10250 [Solirubrobacteraceae bacterium]|nr:hypothetical protein [Solirubrobacteraceae bacterium]